MQYAVQTRNIIKCVRMLDSIDQVFTRPSIIIIILRHPSIVGRRYLHPVSPSEQKLTFPWKKRSDDDITLIPFLNCVVTKQFVWKVEHNM